MQLAEMLALLTAWATEKPLVGRLWLFGSRVRGNHRSDSDVDVAIELDMSAAKGVDESGGMATWAFDTKQWKPELEDLLSLIVDLQRYKVGETNIIQAGLDQSSILVYEKKGKLNFLI
jgi:predicted nucleotidyltransferase